MRQAKKRNVLLPWVIGIAIIAAVNIWIGYRMLAPDCRTPGYAAVIILLVLPVLYLALMYLTLKSQD